MFEKFDKTMKGIAIMLMIIGITMIPVYTIFRCIKEADLIGVKSWVYAGVMTSWKMLILSALLYALGDIVENIRKIREATETKHSGDNSDIYY